MDWQQIAIGVFVGIVAWRIFATIAGSVITVLARRSRLMTRLVARSKADDAAFTARVQRAVKETPTITAASAKHRYY